MMHEGAIKSNDKSAVASATPLEELNVVPVKMRKNNAIATNISPNYSLMLVKILHFSAKLIFSPNAIVEQ